MNRRNKPKRNENVRMNRFLWVVIMGVALAVQMNAVFAAEKSSLYSQKEPEDLVAPVALYPDDLLAHIFTAATAPLDVVKAARYQETHPGVTEPPPEGLRSWEPAVISLMMFPDTLKMMSDNLEWTEAVGNAVYSQEAELYDAVQRMRLKADALGNLATSDRQLVVREKEIIKIIPASPEVIYVPIYDPEVVYVRSCVYSAAVAGPPHPWFFFGTGVAVGIGLSYALDWHHHHVVYHRHWYKPRHHRHHHYYYSRFPSRHPKRHPARWKPKKPHPRVGSYPRHRPKPFHRPHKTTGISQVRRPPVKPVPRPLEKFRSPRHSERNRKPAVKLKHRPPKRHPPRLIRKDPVRSLPRVGTYEKRTDRGREQVSSDKQKRYIPRTAPKHKVQNGGYEDLKQRSSSPHSGRMKRSGRIIRQREDMR